MLGHAGAVNSNRTHSTDSVCGLNGNNGANLMKDIDFLRFSDGRMGEDG